MTQPIAGRPAHSGHHVQSIFAIVGGFLLVIALSVGTDSVFRYFEIFPPLGMPMFDPGLNLLALSYRVGYVVFGGLFTAVAAPDTPMRHVWTLAILEFMIAGIAAFGTLVATDVGPAWYPLAQAAMAIPGTWLGGAIHRALAGKR